MGDEKHRYGEFLWVVKKCWSSVEVVGGRGMVWMNSVPFYFILFSKKKEKKSWDHNHFEADNITYPTCDKKSKSFFKKTSYNTHYIPHNCPLSSLSLSLSLCLIPRSTPPTPTTHTFDRLLLPQPSLRHATDARSIKVILLGLYAAQAAQLLVTLLLPLGDEVRVAVAVLQ